MREDGARRRNRELIAHLQEAGVLKDPAVAAAFESVLRHHFLPGRKLSQVYEDSAIPTKTGEDGLTLSSSSQPAIMALMLQQLELRPGHRVLEVGTGTGYNAALMSRLVAPGGAVFTVDIDADLCEQARANLAAASAGEVQVLQGDGAAGWPSEAPFDRLIVTASASDLAPAWLDQLAKGGRLVVPLALAGPSHLCTALVRRGRTLESDGLSYCGFLPLRGQLSPDQPEEEPEAAIPLPGRPTWISLPRGDVPPAFRSWLAHTHPGYLEARLAPEEPRVFGLRDGAGAALLVPDPDGVSVSVYRDGRGALDQLLAAHRSWLSRRPDAGSLQLTAFPTGADHAVEGGLVFKRSNFTFVVRQSRGGVSAPS